MKYETFLFTRNRQRDFTAFVRPVGMTNKEVSTIANAFNNVNDTTILTPDFPALYLFPLGEHLYLLRHYDSGRTHAGREIPVIEGIAARRELSKSLYAILPHFIARQDELLNVVARHDDIETLEFLPSPQYEWDEWDDTIESVEIPKVSADNELILAFVSRHRDERLFVPFTEAGRMLLLTTVTDLRLPYLYFAFGTNAEVVSSFASSDVHLDVLSYFTTTETAFKPRDVTRRIPAREAQPEAAEIAQQNAAPQPKPGSIPSPFTGTGQGEGSISLEDTQPHKIIPRRRQSVLNRLLDVLLGQRSRR